MEKRKKDEEEEEEGQAVWASVPSDLLPEILSRVPYRSLCRFKCVSRAWLALCSDPAVRKRSPQAISGFFCQHPSRPGIRFFNLSGRSRPMVDPALRFLHGYDRVTLLSCCGGILLCGGWDRDRTTQRQVYLVCNPATEQIWAALPVPAAQAGSKNRTTYLCVDDRRRFAVFFFIHDLYHTQQVQVYSSDTGEWTCAESGWGPRIVVSGGESDYFFFNGTLHFTAYDCGEETFDSEGNRLLKITGWVVTVDMDAKTWRTIRAPHKAFFSFIGQSQGRIYGLQMYRTDYRLSVWVLEDYASGQWILRSILELLGRRPYRNPGEFYSLVAIHPESNLVFLIGGDGLDKKLMSYDMDNRKLHVIYTLEEYDKLIFWPYIPCFEERPSDSAQ